MTATTAAPQMMIYVSLVSVPLRLSHAVTAELASLLVIQNCRRLYVYCTHFNPLGIHEGFDD
jgi:hypothetical protein